MQPMEFIFQMDGHAVKVRVSQDFVIRCLFTVHGDEARWMPVPFQYANKEQAKRDIRAYFKG